MAFDILQTARTHAVDRILMGYPEEHPGVVETVEYNAPCGVFFVSNVDEVGDLSTINVGAGGGPHHLALMPLVNQLGRQGAEIHVISIEPQSGGTGEPVEETVSALSGAESLQVHNVSANSVAEGLVSTAVGNGGLLVIGATRDRRLRRWVFGSTPDRVIELAREADIPVLIYATPSGISRHLEDYFYPLYRYVRRRLGASRPSRPVDRAGETTGEAPRSAAER